MVWIKNLYAKRTPECNGEQAFPGAKQGETPQCPKCAIPMKPNYVQEEE